jgi:hypothetical protein
MSKAQAELLSFVERGCFVCVCIDSRICGVRVYFPGQFSYISETLESRLTWRTVVKLLNLGKIEVVRHDGQSTVYKLASK